MRIKGKFELTNQERIVIHLLKELPTKTIAATTGISWARLRYIERYLKIHKVYFYWTASQDEYLKNNYKKKPIKEISLNVNRSIFATHKRAKLLGLKK